MGGLGSPIGIPGSGGIGGTAPTPAMKGGGGGRGSPAATAAATAASGGKGIMALGRSWCWGEITGRYWHGSTVW